MSGVRVELNRSYWASLMNSPELQKRLQSAAERVAAASDARCGQPTRPRTFKNPNFVAETDTRQGRNSPYLVGLVIAANPRSIWKSTHDGVLRP